MGFTSKDGLDDEADERSLRGRGAWGKPNPVDVHVGHRLRLRRTLLGLSQQKVGEALGLTFQQVQKYERGANRIGASRLWDLSGVLDCPISFFFEEMEEPTEDTDENSKAATQANRSGAPEDDTMNRRETLELVRAYYRINGEQVRKRIYELTKSLAANEEKAAAEGAGETPDESKDSPPTI